MKILVASVSAIALAVVPALAQGNGNGNNGNRGGPPTMAGPSNPGNGNGNAKANRGNSGGGQMQARGNAGGPPQARGNGNDRGGPPQARGNGNDRGGPPAARGNGNGNDRGGPPVARGNGNDRGGPPVARGNGNGGGPMRGGERVAVRYDDGPNLDFRRLASVGIAEGCPPGLAKKYNGCRPPGLARQQDQYRYSRYAPDWWGLGGLFGDRRGSYFYDDGYLLRIGSNGGISGYIPLLGGALSIGNPWPQDYRYSRLPTYYEDYYGLGPSRNYRYADNVVYRMDPETAAITSIAALLTGDEFRVGQRMPRGYDVYNVPYSYRDRYYDRPDAMYRYNDGYVYEIDPETMLVASAIELLI